MKNIPEDLSNKIKTPLQTPANNADPKMSVTVVRAKDTIMDSTYWTTEVIRTKPGLGDLSVAPRRFKPYGSPNRIYEINIQNGIVATSIREYPDKFKEGWKEQFTLGPGKAVAVAFNGEWKYYKKRYRLVTDEKPWISWVDLDGNLFVQLWDEENTKIQLSSNVIKVKMIRAWKNTVIHYLDQGIVAAYIKTDGKVYYRNFCIQENYTEAWEYEKQLNGFTGVAVNVNLFITNDYRMGFTIEDTLGQIHWLVTHRNWGGMASPAENLVTGLRDIKFEVTPIKYYETRSDEEYLKTSISINRFYVCPADTVPEIIGTERLSFTDNKTIKIIFNYNLECELDNLRNSLTLRNAGGQPYIIDTVTEEGMVLTIKTVEEMPTSQDIIVSSPEIQPYYLAFRVTSTCLYDYGDNLNLTIKGLPPIGHSVESVTFDILPTFNVTQVYYSEYNGNDDNISMAISNVNFIVTKVGNNPL